MAVLLSVQASACDLSPKPTVTNTSARTLMRQGRKAEALESFREELRLRPDSPIVQVEIASTYWGGGISRGECGAVGQSHISSVLHQGGCTLVDSRISVHLELRRGARRVGIYTHAR